MPRTFLVPLAWLGSSSSTVRRSSSRVLPTLDPLARPPSWRALTGLWSRRLLDSAARRMSSSPIVRISLALASYSGLFDSDFMRASRKPSTFWSSIGTAAAGTAGAILGAEVAPTCCIGAGASRVKVSMGRGERLDGRILDRGLLGHNSFVPLLWAPTRAHSAADPHLGQPPSRRRSNLRGSPDRMPWGFPPAPPCLPAPPPSKGHSDPVERALWPRREGNLALFWSRTARERTRWNPDRGRAGTCSAQGIRRLRLALIGRAGSLRPARRG